MADNSNDATRSVTKTADVETALCAHIAQLITAMTSSAIAPIVAMGLSPMVVKYFEELQSWNRSIRLVGQSSNEALLYHLADSLSSYRLLASLTGGAGVVVGDVGSGNGMPGIPLALCMPQVRFQLIESNQKRCAFLQNVISLLDLQNCTVVHSRIEQLAHQQQHQSVFRVLLARALTNWNTELAASFSTCLGENGVAIVYAAPQSIKSEAIAVSLRASFPIVQNVKAKLSSALKHVPNAHLPSVAATFLVASFG